MRCLRVMLARIIGFFTGHRGDGELFDEMQAHLDMEIAENIRRGMHPDEARRLALVASGGLARAAEAVHDQRGLPWIESLTADIRYASRSLRHSPVFSIVVVITLALGIGANAAIFSIFDQFLLRPMPVQQPGQLVNFSSPGPAPGFQSCGQAGDCDGVFSYAMFSDLARAQTAFTGIAAHALFDANLSARNHTLSGEGVLVSGSYFRVLGLQPTLGRLLGDDDDRAPGQSRVAVLSYDYWQGTFGRDPSILNQTLIVNGQPMTVVGVGPRRFIGTTLGATPEVFVPITTAPLMLSDTSLLTDRRNAWAYLFARLKPGVSIGQAAAGINVPYHAILNNVEASLPWPWGGMSPKTMTAFLGKRIELKPGSRGQSALSHDTGAPLTLLLAVTAFVLLISCANIANLLLARGSARAGEMAVRLSIGGSRRQLIAQLLAESGLLGLIGGALGLVVARGTLGAMAAMLPSSVATTFDIHLDTTIMVFTGVLALTTAIAFGLFPALYATRPDLLSMLRASTGQPAGGRSASRWRTSLATAQIALSMALLGAAGLFTRSLANITNVDLGMKVDHVVTFRISPELSGYNSEQTQQLMQHLDGALRQVPGVTGVTASEVPLLAGQNRSRNFNVEGVVAGPDADRVARYNWVGAGYLGVLGVPLITGREFTSADAIGAPKVAIVNQAFARKFNLGSNPIGRRIDDGNKNNEMEIVGLAQNATYSRVKDEAPPVVYKAYTQDVSIGAATFYVRTTLDPTRLIPAIPRMVAQLDATLPVEDLRTLPEQVRQNVFLDRFIGIFSAAFAALATLIAAIGLYGVLAQTVAQRTREIGVRMALGAAPGRVRLMILRQVGLMTTVGGVIGIAAAIGLGQLAQSQLYRMRGYDPEVLAAAAVTLSLVALGAGLVPAFRASRVEPTRALRHE
jgi:predicted permease